MKTKTTKKNKTTSFAAIIDNDNVNKPTCNTTTTIDNNKRFKSKSTAKTAVNQPRKTKFC